MKFLKRSTLRSSRIRFVAFFHIINLSLREVLITKQRNLELCPPDCVGVDPVRKSTWMRPIIGDKELHGGKLLPDGTRIFHSSRTVQRMLHDFNLFLYENLQRPFRLCYVGIVILKFHFQENSLHWR